MIKILKLIIINIFFMTTLYAESKLMLEKYTEVIPLGVKVNIKNNESEPEFLNYVFVKTIDAPIRKDSSINSQEIMRLPYNTKMKVLEKIKVGKNDWYKVSIKTTTGESVIGYVSANLVSIRKFRFEKMNKKVEDLSNFLKSEAKLGKELVSTNTYIPNPKNENMNRLKDKYGVSADQNAVGMYGDEIIYIPDRSLMSIESLEGDYAYVNVFSIPEKPLKVHKRVLSRNPVVNSNFKKVIVIDLENENQGIFEKNKNEEWELISYTLNKTGLESTLGFETPKGNFIVPVAKYEMFYTDQYGRLAGLAKYAIRFSGGGYIHGTPIDFEENINRDFFLEQKDGTLGTVEGTRKCIRNSEAHIKFLFDWITNGKVNRKSNDQRPDENVMVIVF
ncbi:MULTISPECIES: L,D-transpeptidase family protein [unclassified Cetobacterium]|uniref:L,D-transpeptidase family protein n=1 Tax=unclassified Cetobacterium TaxID=2630983 RepID=UPI00068CA2AA|nr:MULTISPECIES: L,D-transpeptidase family protein [unclassified Cetobacterium]